MGSIPADDPIQRIGERQSRHPTQALGRFAAVEMEEVGLVRVFSVVDGPGRSFTPYCCEVVGDLTHCHQIVLAGTEVPGFRDLRAFVVERFGEGEVTKIDKKIGRVWVKYTFGAKEQEKAFAYTNIATSEL